MLYAGDMFTCACWFQDGPEGEYTVHFNSYEEGGKVGKPQSIKVDAVIGADGANSRVAKEIDAGEYDYAIAFQVCLPSLLLLRRQARGDSWLFCRHFRHDCLATELACTYVPAP